MNILAASSKKQFFGALLVSLGLHLFLILVLPGLPMGDFALPKKSYAEVQLVYIPPKPVKITKKLGAKPKKAKIPLPKQGNLLTEQINKLSKLDRFQGITPEIELPAEATEEELSGLLPKVDFPLEDIILPAGPPLAAVQKPQQKNKIFPPFGTQGDKQLKPTSRVGIEWAGPPRRPLFQPVIPQYSSKVEGEVRLKFWVDPAGKVNNVIVLRKLDAYLERISLQYMKQWLFEPLLPNVEQTLQWGTITIRFRRD